MNMYPESIPAVETCSGVTGEDIAALTADRTTPLLIKGATSHWPMVVAAKAGNLSQYLAAFDRGLPVMVFRAAAETEGRIFYDDTMSGFNFSRGAGDLMTTLRSLEQEVDRSEHCYVGSTPVDRHLPSLRAQNDLPIGELQPLVSLWFGNRTRVAAHFDLPENLACVVAGRRRFTLFPPEQVANLYPGPLDFNPAGQAISLVDFYKPDFARYPNYQKALEAAQVAEMEPGDVLYVPSMWWHQVESLDAVNMLVNYWWRSTPNWTGLPQDALMHALLSIGGLPKSQREAWGQLFEHFVVNRDAAAEAIPEHRRGLLADLDRNAAANLKKHLLEKLQRMP
ncbi:cupin-like domain-containing protein [Microbulbifer sp. Q7]|uniref:cupin-like domain-containing protein n=1 Tax=Microbulbifer sp. Q7 TaxID=1785091 RepID=UPI0008351808|nr:cupin-like domain-containing protein [Microbulbifer sp. Q7]